MLIKIDVGNGKLITRRVGIMKLIRYNNNRYLVCEGANEIFKLGRKLG